MNIKNSERFSTSLSQCLICSGIHTQCGIMPGSLSFILLSLFYFLVLFFIIVQRVSLEDRGRLVLRLSKWRRPRRWSCRLLFYPLISSVFNYFFYFSFQSIVSGNAWRKTNQKLKREYEKFANMAVGNNKKSE